MTRFKEKIDEIEERIEEIKEPKKEKKKKDRVYVSTGSTLLNLALSDRVDGGYPLGRIINLIGDSSSGKTLLALTMMAEATINKSLDKHLLIYDEPEAGMEFDLEGMFGSNMKRIKFWPKKREKPRTTQDWHDDLLKTLVKDKESMVYVLDSFDALNVEEDLKEETTLKKGGYRTGKAVASSETLRKICGMGEGTGSVMVLISQTRQNLVMFGPSRTRSGGDALKFYSSLEIWLHNGPKIVKKVRGQDEEIGHYVVAKLGKNRLTGKKRSVTFPVYYDYGVDDIRSMIEWLLEKGFWEYEKATENNEEEQEKGKRRKKKTEVVDTQDDFINAEVPELIRYIEENSLEQKLKEIVQESWNQLESEIADKRKPRYA